MKILWLILSLLTCFLILPSPSIVEAHPGRTDSSGGHTCRTNCDRWGLGYGEYHYHGGGGASSGGSSSNSYTAPVQEIVIYPTNTPIPTRIPTAIPTKIPTPAPTATPTLSPTSSPTPSRQPAKSEKVNHISASTQTPQGFFEWLFSLFQL